MEYLTTILNIPFLCSTMNITLNSDQNNHYAHVLV